MRLPRLPPLTLSALLALGAAVVLVTWLATHRGAGIPEPAAGRQTTTAPTTTAPTTTTAPQVAAVGPLALTAAGLRAEVRALGQRVYWLGPEPGHRYELRRATNGNVFLRYLPPGTPAGATRALRTVGTYPTPNAYTALEGIAGVAGAVHRKLAGGWLAVYQAPRPTSIYLARPGLDYQIEVYDPSGETARSLVISGRLRRVG